MTTNRSSEELAMRELIVPELRRRWPDARIIHELPLRYSTSRIDLAAVTETEIVSVEIKSSKDVADRLEDQLRAFAPVSSRIIVALAPKWNEKLPMVEKPPRPGWGRGWVPQYTIAQAALRRVRKQHWNIETWTVDAEQALIEDTEGKWTRNAWPWPLKMLHMLHVAELAEIAFRHRCYAATRRTTHLALVNACAEHMTGAETVRAVCRALRERAAFASASDDPVKARAAA